MKKTTFVATALAGAALFTFAGTGAASAAPGEGELGSLVGADTGSLAQ